MPKYELNSVEHKKYGGFTLLELLVTITILSALSVLAVPSFNSFVANQRIKSVSYDLISTLVSARSEAIKRNAGVIVTPITTGGVTNWQNGWTVATAAAPTVPLIQRPALTGMTVVCKADASSAAITTSACPAITFNAFGRLSAGSTSPAIQVTGANGGYRRCIGIDLSGRPESTKGSASGSASTWVCP